MFDQQKYDDYFDYLCNDPKATEKVANYVGHNDGRDDGQDSVPVSGSGGL